jgi:hypothetical protein
MHASRASAWSASPGRPGTSALLLASWRPIFRCIATQVVRADQRLLNLRDASRLNSLLSMQPVRFLEAFFEPGWPLWLREVFVR